MAVLFEASLAGLAWALGWLIGLPPFARFRWNLWDTALGIAAAVPMLLVFLSILCWPVGPLAGIKRFCDLVVLPLFRSCTLFDLAVIAAVAGAGEEMLFRGVLQAAFSRWLGDWLGLALAGLVFGLVHAISPTYILIAALFGVYLGFLWIATDNLLVVIVTHGLYDFLVLAYLVRRSAGD